MWSIHTIQRSAEMGRHVDMSPRTSVRATGSFLRGTLQDRFSHQRMLIVFVCGGTHAHQSGFASGRMAETGGLGAKNNRQKRGITQSEIASVLTDSDCIHSVKSVNRGSVGRTCPLSVSGTISRRAYISTRCNYRRPALTVSYSPPAGRRSSLEYGRIMLFGMALHHASVIFR